jgi:carboxymethylenebutenolidase
VNALEARLRDARVDVQFHHYLAHHAFANETAIGAGRISRTQFDPVWAQQAWDRTFTFLGRTMRRTKAPSADSSAHHTHV